MNGLKLVAVATLLGIPLITACAPPIGSITGKVMVEGTGIASVLVTLNTGAHATTAADGVFRFDGVEPGAYSVRISNFPPDAGFPARSANATVETDGQVVTVDFPGSWIRTSAIIGSVTVEGEGLSGVTVTVTGMGTFRVLTDGNGLASFTNLRKGTYTIEISGFDTQDVEFEWTRSTHVVDLGESSVVNFEGTRVSASANMGRDPGGHVVTQSPGQGTPAAPTRPSLHPRQPSEPSLDIEAEAP